LLLQPTSPLRTAADIDAAVALAQDKKADAVVSVCSAATHPYVAMTIKSDGRLADFGPRPDGYLRRQDLPPAYALNGALYLVRRETLAAEKTFCPANTVAYVMPPERSLDVDTPFDLHLARLLLEKPLK
jgi:CMP-N-acetylneuraminic acid synthetase